MFGWKVAFLYQNVTMLPHFDVRTIFVIISSTLQTETNYVLQLLVGVPIGQLVAYHNTVMKAFIVVCAKCDSSIL